MAAANVLPVVPFLGLLWLGIPPHAVRWGYRMTTIVMVLMLMRHQRSAYSTAR